MSLVAETKVTAKSNGKGHRKSQLHIYIYIILMEIWKETLKAKEQTNYCL